MRYFFHIGYNGSHYRGWQRQPKVLSVQEVLETVTSQVFNAPAACIGCSRTDAGVHAVQFFFHIDIEKQWDFDLTYKLNKMLPEDIAVFGIIPMEGLPHAQFDATQRTYDYFIHTRKDPFLNEISSLYPEKPLDLYKMKEAVSLLPKYSDFRAFCKAPDRHNNTICNVTSATLFSGKTGGKLRFQISSNRFLNGMIRIIVKKLVDIGAGSLSTEEFKNSLVNKEPPPFLKYAYPQGLYLSKVTYPFLDIPPGKNFSDIFQNDDENFWQLV